MGAGKNALEIHIEAKLRDMSFRAADLADSMASKAVTLKETAVWIRKGAKNGIYRNVDHPMSFLRSSFEEYHKCLNELNALLRVQESAKGEKQ